MRFINSVRADMKFQMKQGFYFVYAVITVMYLIILSFLPPNVLKITLPLIVFSDPSVLGLFFIGAIIMLEKSQGVLMVLVVSPLRTIEYILSKTLSLAFISVLAALVITLFSKYHSVNWLLLVISIILTSSIFTLCGIMINAGCNSVNQYMLKTIPYMLLLVLPCLSLIQFPYSYLFTVIPSVAALRLMLGAYMGIGWLEAFALIIYLIIVNYFILKLTVRVFESKIISPN